MQKSKLRDSFRPPTGAFEKLSDPAFRDSGIAGLRRTFCARQAQQAAPRQPYGEMVENHFNGIVNRRQEIPSS